MEERKGGPRLKPVRAPYNPCIPLSPGSPEHLGFFFPPTCNCPFLSTLWKLTAFGVLTL